MSAPLDGVRVLEIARVLAGPWAGQTLADLGADVIKVESPEGDDTRAWGPPFIARREEKTAAYFHGCNRGKRSVIADLKAASDLASVQALAAQADVVIENYKLGALEKYGLDYASLSRSNPGVVYCSITGFGQTGPRASEPGYDLLIQAMSGVMDVTGAADGPPMKMGVAFTDIFSGLYAVIGIQAALSEREKTGRGQHIDISLFDCMTGVLANQAQNFLATGHAPKRRGNAHPNLTPYEEFQAADGHLVVAAGNNRQFRALCEVLDLSEVPDDPRFATNAARLENHSEMYATLQGKIGEWQRSDLFLGLRKAGVPAGPINTVEDAFNDPQFVARDMLVDHDGEKGLRTPLVFSDSALRLDQGVPSLGETDLASAKWSRT